MKGRTRLSQNTIKNISILSLGIVCIFYIASVGLAGGSFLGFLLYALAFALLVYIPGLFLAKMFMPNLSAFAMPIVATGVGSSMLILCFVAFGAVGFLYGTYIIPIVLSVAYLYKLVTGSNAKQSLSSHRIELTNTEFTAGLFLLSLLIFLTVFGGVFHTAWPSAVGGAVYNQDALWSVGSAASPWYGFPVLDLRTAGGIFHYHYFSDVVAGLVAIFSGQHTWNVNFFYLRPLWVVLIAMGSFEVARNLGAKGWQAFIPPVGICLGMFRNYGAILYTFNNPNNVNQSYVFMLGAILAFQQAEKENFDTAKQIPALLLTLTAALWSKGSVGLLFLIALFAAWVVYAILQKYVCPNAVVSLVLGGIVAFLLMKLLFSGANINLYTDISVPRLKEVLLGAFKENTPLLILYAISLIYSLKNFKTLSFMGLALNAVAFGGIMANCIFNHYGGADTYFTLVSLFAMWLSIAEVLPKMFEKKAIKNTVLALCMVGIAGNALTAMPIFRHGVQVALRCAGVRPPFEQVYETLNADDEAAALWLRENMTSDDVFATNRNERSLENRDGVFLGYTALSGRQAYVEGWFYAMEYSMDYYELRHNLEEVSDKIFACETFEEAVAIAKENGITYLLLHLPSGGAPFEGGTPAFSSGTVLVYRV